MEKTPSPWDDAAASEVILWTREYNVEAAEAEAAQCARQTRGTILWSAALIDAAFVVILLVMYGGVEHRDAKVHPDAVVPSRVMNVCALLVMFVIGVRSILLVWGIQKETVVSTRTMWWTLQGARYGTVLLLLLYGAIGLALLLVWNALHLPCMRHLDAKFWHSHWGIPLSWARSIQRHSHQLYLPFLILCIIEAIRYFILRSYMESISPANYVEDDGQRRRGLEGLEDDALHAPLLPMSNAPVAHWWNRDFWTSSPAADLAPLHDAWARRSELEGPLWWSRDEEDIERDLLSSSSR